MNVAMDNLIITDVFMDCYICFYPNGFKHFWLSLLEGVFLVGFFFWLLLFCWVFWLVFFFPPILTASEFHCLFPELVMYSCCYF